MLQRVDGRKIPLYQKVKDYVTDNIRSGVWDTGHLVPSENELKQHFGMSRMTIHRALRELTNDGWLMRVQGAGTFVAGPRPQSAVLSITSIADEVRARGAHYSNRVITQQEEKVTPLVADPLNLASGAKVFHTVIVHFENDQPIQLEDRYVNPVAVPGYLEQDFSQVPPYDYLIKAAPLSKAEHSIQAVAPTPEQAELLQLKAGNPCLMIRRRTWSGITPVTFAKLLHPGDRYSMDGNYTN